MKNKIAQGTMLLTVTSFIVKILSAVYRVPFQNLVGDEGFYVYQQVYPIYGIAMTLALSGLPVFISKLVAEQKDGQGKKQVLQAVFPYLFWLSISLFLFIYFGSDWLALRMGDKDLASVIQMVSFVFILTPILSCYRGFYQGNLWMTPTAISQVLEQLVRVAIILFAAYCFTRQDWSIYQIGTIAMAGALCGEMVAYLCLRKYRGSNPPIVRVKELFQHTEQSGIGKRLLFEGGLLCFYSAYLVLFQLVDSFVIKNALVQSGLSEIEAKMAKGVYDRGQPLVQLGLVVAVSMTAVFLPSLTQYVVRKQEKKFLETIQSYLRVSLVIALSAAVGLSFLLPYVNVMLFGDNQGVVTLQVFVFAIALMAIIQVFQTIYQSQNQMKRAVTAVVAGFLVKIVVTYPLTVAYGTVGASVATLVGLSSCLFLLSLGYLKITQKKQRIIPFLWKFSGCLGMMILTLIGFNWIVSTGIGIEITRVSAIFLAFIGVFLGGGILLYSIIRMNVFTLREWLLIPYGKKILRLKMRWENEIR